MLNFNPNEKEEMRFIRQVNLKPFLKRYLSYYYPVDPYFELSEKNRYGSYLISCLRFKTQAKEDPFEYHVADRADILKISIPEHYERNFGIIITRRDKFRFNQFLLDDFHERLVEYVYPQLTGRKGEIKIALLNFMQKYAITEDELQYRTIEKMYLRERHRAIAYKSMA